MMKEELGACHILGNLEIIVLNNIYVGWLFITMYYFEYTLIIIGANVTSWIVKLLLYNYDVISV